MIEINKQQAEYIINKILDSTENTYPAIDFRKEVYNIIKNEISPRALITKDKRIKVI